MTLHHRGDGQQLLRGQGAAVKGVGAHGGGGQQGGGGAEAPADGNMGIDMHGKAPGGLAQRLHHGQIGLIGQIVRPGVAGVAAGNPQACAGFFQRQVGVQGQGAAEAVKARAEIGGGGGNANGNG